ncbi:hypothetical protein SDC9_147607 [bioreactor metagenome]|uniref:Uncharacterized protein n=1 Tax=bioreactor metagenome TaxID=1076179 RepID=A0A645EIK5_9ZZZZ
MLGKQLEDQQFMRSFPVCEFLGKKSERAELGFCEGFSWKFPETHKQRRITIILFEEEQGIILLGNGEIHKRWYLSQSCLEFQILLLK